MLSELSYENKDNVYEIMFEKGFLNQSGNYYKQLSNKKVAASSAVEYISTVESHITAELARNELYTTKIVLRETKKK